MPNLLTRLAGLARGEGKGTRPLPPRTGAAFAFTTADRPVWTPRDYGALAREGFCRNAVVHRAVRLVAESAAATPLVAPGEPHEGTRALLALLARPNPREGGARLLEALYGHLMVSGNAALWSKCTKGNC